jgi:hypothetical protein
LTRRADAERIHQARRIAVRNRLTDYGMPLDEAERWCNGWEAEAERLELPRDGDFWTVGDAWIAEERAQRRKPG